MESFFQQVPVDFIGALTDIGITRLLKGGKLVGVSAVTNEVDEQLWELVVLIHPDEPSDEFRPFPADPGDYGMDSFVLSSLHSTVPWNNGDEAVLAALFEGVDPNVDVVQVHIRSFAWRPMDKKSLDLSEKGRRTRYRKGVFVSQDHGVWVNKEMNVAHAWNVLDPQGAYSTDGYAFREHRLDKDTIGAWMGLRPDTPRIKMRTAELSFVPGPVPLKRL